MINNKELGEDYGFITQGIYKQVFIPNIYYQIENFIPVIVNGQPKLIGEGRFSKVYLYKHKNNDSLFALKKISIQKIIESGNDVNIIKREIDIHSRIEHENIVQFYSVKQELNEVNILLEYCRDGSIYELISKNGFDEEKTYSYFSQVVNAVYFLHKNNLVHRDIKPENILVNLGKIKLCDFGWCCETNLNNRKTFCGTFEYMAPEIINELPYGKPVDIWALGILLYEFYFGISPFTSSKQNEEQTQEIINNILMKKLNFPSRKSIPYDMKDLIMNMLEMDIQKRYTIEQVTAHPWFRRWRINIKNKINIMNTSINNNNNMNPFPDTNITNITKITKIIKNKNDIMNKSIYKFKNLKFYSPSKDGRNVPINHPEKENIYKNNYSSNQISHLRNIDINVNEDNSTQIKSYYQTNTTIPVSFNNLKLNRNTQKNNSAMKNKSSSNEIYRDDYFYKKIKSIPNKSINIQNRSNSLNKMNIKNRIQNIYSYNNYNSNYNTNNDDNLNNSIFFPMDSVLEEANNMKSQKKKSSIPIHRSVASVVKLNNTSKNNSFNINSINNNNNIQVNELINRTKAINNINYLNNNFHTFNEYNQFNDNGYSENFNYTYIYPYQNKILVSNEYI